jgi:hypothetical protein
LQLSYGLAEARELCLQNPRRCTTFEDRNMHLRLTIKPAGFRSPHAPAALTALVLSSTTLGGIAGGIGLACITGVNAATTAPICMACLAMIPGWVVAVRLLHQSAIAMFQQADLDLGPSRLVLYYSMAGVETARLTVSTDRLRGASTVQIRPGISGHFLALALARAPHHTMIQLTISAPPQPNWIKPAGPFEWHDMDGGGDPRLDETRGVHGDNEPGTPEPPPTLPSPPPAPPVTIDFGDGLLERENVNYIVREIQHYLGRPPGCMPTGDVCSSTPCQHSGRCINDFKGGYRCDCAVAKGVWYGPHCELLGYPKRTP